MWKEICGEAKQTWHKPTIWIHDWGWWLGCTHNNDDFADLKPADLPSRLAYVLVNGTYFRHGAFRIARWISFMTGYVLYDVPTYWFFYRIVQYVLYHYNRMCSSIFSAGFWWCDQNHIGHVDLNVAYCDQISFLDSSSLDFPWCSMYHSWWLRFSKLGNWNHWHFGSSWSHWDGSKNNFTCFFPKSQPICTSI